MRVLYHTFAFLYNNLGFLSATIKQKVINKTGFRTDSFVTDYVTASAML
jgi:hypothetical protein